MPIASSSPPLFCRRARPILLGAYIVLGAMGARAVPPLVTDDAEVAEKDVFEIYAGYDYESGGGTITRQLPTTEIDYGIIDRVELNLEMPYLSTDGVTGWGDIALGFKWVALEETKTRPMIAASFEWKLANASVSRGLGTDRFDYEFLIPVQKTWGRFTGMVNFGLDFLGDPRIDGVTEPRNNVWFFGFAQRYKLNDKTTLLSEIYTRRAEEPGLPNVFAANVGFEREIRHGLALQASIGRSLREAGAGGPDLHVYVGLHGTFDAPWKREKKADK
jgi:hypothetical protein